MFAGLGAARIRRLFREARKAAPAIIFIDELDAVGARRGTDNNSEREQTLNQLLVEMDGFPASDRVVVMAASNLLEKLDPALLRPGRFDRQVFVSPPDVEGRRAILEVHTRDKPLRDVDLDLVARQTSGLTGADLANLCNEAAIRCARRKGHALAQKDFDQALERVIAGVRVHAPPDRPRAPRRRLPRGRPRAVPASCCPRVDRAAQGLDRPARQRAGLRDEPARGGPLPQDARGAHRLHDRLLGGRVAEELVFGAVTTGAANDLQKVAEITHAMVHDYAMGAVGHRPARLDRRRRRLRASRRASATRSSASWPSRPSRPRATIITDAPRQARRARRGAARARGARPRATSTASWATSPRIDRRATVRLRIAAADPDAA